MYHKEYTIINLSYLAVFATENLPSSCQNNAATVWSISEGPGQDTGEGVTMIPREHLIGRKQNGMPFPSHPFPH